MLDIKRIRQNPQELCKAMKARGKEVPIEQLIAQDDERRKLLAASEEIKTCRNAESKKIGMARKNGASAAEMDQITEKIRVLSEQITSFDARVSELDASLQAALLTLPNYPHASVPSGSTKEDNIVIRHWGNPRQFLWEPKTHCDIGSDLKILDEQSYGGNSGAHYSVYRGSGARLERSIINFFLNTHSENGYEELHPPYIVRSGAAAAGHSSEAAKDACETDIGVISQTTVAGLYRDKILEASLLPVRHSVYSPCFCAMTGSSNRDMHGLLHHHRLFDNVELVMISDPEQSYDDLESMTGSAERVLMLLGLPYRVVLVSAGAMSFSAAKTYAIEVWMPGCNRYVEISTCSNCEDFQARRAGIRCRRNPKEKLQYVHTINGSGLAAGRTVAAILENYQNEDGTVTVPDVLIPYMGTDLIK